MMRAIMFGVLIFSALVVGGNLAFGNFVVALLVAIGGLPNAINVYARLTN